MHIVCREKEARKAAAANEAQKTLQKLRKLEDDMSNFKEELDKVVRHSTMNVFADRESSMHTSLY